MSSSLAIIALVVILVIATIALYNSLVRLRQNVRESWSAIDTELRRRYDLIPNIVETVKGYATHERQTLDEVVNARNNAIAAQGSPQAQGQAENVLSGALRQLFALSENYPQLKANESFLGLQKELDDTENRISQARRFYNANVRELNTACESFPSSVVAGSFGFHSEQYFGIDDDAARKPVSVKF